MKAFFFGATPVFFLLSYSFVLIYIVFLPRRFEDMKHYAENLGTNVAAMIKVRQVTALAKFFEAGFTCFHQLVY